MTGEQLLTRIDEARKRAKFPADADDCEEREKTTILAELADEQTGYRAESLNVWSIIKRQDKRIEALERRLNKNEQLMVTLHPEAC